MREIPTYANGNLRKANDTVSCKFRGVGIECPRGDFRAGLCEVCGWNPLIEADRIARLRKK